MAEEGSRTKRLNTATFWHIIFPILILLILLFVLFVIYTMPDWAITCSSGLASVRQMAANSAVP
jgi:hypothetical protein